MMLEAGQDNGREGDVRRARRLPSNNDSRSEKLKKKKSFTQKFYFKLTINIRELRIDEFHQ